MQSRNRFLNGYENYRIINNLLELNSPAEGQAIRYETLDGRPKQLTVLKVQRAPLVSSLAR
jgi:hypothetical protein